MANTTPIVVGTPQIDFGDTALTAANTAVDGTGTVITAFTADSTNGSFIQYLKFKPAASAAATTLTCARIFINNGSDPTTAANNIFFDSITLPSTTEAINAGQPPVIIPMNLALPASYRITVVIATASANGWYVCGVGGKF